MLYQRNIEQKINEYLDDKNNHKILFIWGPRRSGKTTILKKISQKNKTPIFNFDLLSDQEKFTADIAELKKIADEHKLILIDEVQNYPEATAALKILFDQFKVKIIATGSSELRRKSENFDSLAGRYLEIFCLPLTLSEIENNTDKKQYQKKDFYADLADSFCIFGAYPEIYSAKKEDEKIELLQNILDTYVIKDIINIYELKNAKLAKDILTKIALQIGSEVSVRKIASSLGATAVTVANYIEIFVKNYILFPLPSFKTNSRRAVSSNKKYYFLDLGLRNILIRDFRPLALRPDRGGVLENFIIAEIHKKIVTEKKHFSLFFYREYSGREVDLVLESYKKEYFCLEIKNKKEKVEPVFPIKHELKVLDRENYFEEIDVIGK